MITLPVIVIIGIAGALVAVMFHHDKHRLYMCRFCHRQLPAREMIQLACGDAICADFNDCKVARQIYRSNADKVRFIQ